MSWKSLQYCGYDGCEWIGSHDDWLTYISGSEMEPVAPSWRMSSRPVPSVRCYDGGNLVEVKIPRPDSPPIGGPRGVVTGFSAGSRLRLLKTLACLRKDTLPVFVTLTYPAAWPSDPKQWKAHFHAFRNRMARRFPGFGAVWRLEFQKRGAPHWHLLVYGCPLAELRRVVGPMWYEVVKSGDPKHLAAGTRVERIRSYRGVMSYASKYMSKTEESSRRAGRLWGYVGKDNLPWAEELGVDVAECDAWEFRRYMTRFSGRRAYGKNGMSIFADGGQWWRLLVECVGVF